MVKVRVPYLENFEFQPAVLDKDLSTPESGVVKGDRYIVGSSASGDWATKEKNIAWYDGVEWKFDAPKKGTLVFVSDENIFYFYNDSNWVLLVEELGLGDMLKTVYDTDENGIVDKAESIDDGAGNTATASDIKDAVDKKHAHSNKAILDAIEQAFTTALKTSYDDAVSKAHTQNTDTKLDEGGANEVSASEVKGAVTNSHTHTNKAILDAIDVSFTTVLKANYDDAYNKRAQIDNDLGIIFFDL